MKSIPAHLTNKGCVKELTYSVFRNFEDGATTYWHLHGDAQNINSINLGYEHYCGQLQRMREYVTGGYRNEKKSIARLFRLPLLTRGYLNTGTVYSWLDLFFTDHTTIKILGFKLDLEEIDLWWLLTYRAKIMFGAKKGLRVPKANKIEYYIPQQFTMDAAGKYNPQFKNKKDLMEKLDITVKIIDQPHSEAFYLAALQ